MTPVGQVPGHIRQVNTTHTHPKNQLQIMSGYQEWPRISTRRVSIDGGYKEGIIPKLDLVSVNSVHGVKVML